MKLAICEDEKQFQDVILEYLKPYLSERNDISIDVFPCGADILKKYNCGKRYDLVFLDVEMKGMTGVEVGRTIREIDSSVILIFITSYTQYVRHAFSINAFQYLLKPVMREVFNEEFERALEYYRKMKYVYQIKFNDETTSIEVGNIVYIETFSRHLRVRTQDNCYEYVGKIKEAEDKLEPYGFIRCHQGYLVNMRYIYKPKPGFFILNNKAEIPISRQLKNVVMTKYNKYMTRCCL